MKRATSSLRLSWRIGVSLYESDVAFGELERFLRDHTDIVDEAALFETTTHHLYFPLDVFARRAAILRQRIASLKRAGVGSAGINVLCTIGHVNEGWDYMPPLPFQAMVGHDGALSRSCACPNAADFREYVRQKYRLMAGAAPDFIWVDDDIRMHHHGVAFGCFCPTCLGIFARTTGRSWTRETLVSALDDPAGGALRAAWVEQNCASLESLMADVRRAIAEVNPGIVTGLMTCGAGWSTYSGPQLGRWFAALGAGKARPGGGFYNDDNPFAMVHKAFECGRQLVDLPAAVTDRQYELENFPYSALSKSAASLVNECTLALACGMNGIAMNALGWRSPDWTAERRTIMQAVRGARGYWQTIVDAAIDCRGAGLWPAWSAQTAARRSLQPHETWFEGDWRHNYGQAHLLAAAGLPLTPQESGDGVVLVGRMPEAFGDDELRRMLAGGVFMDAAALAALHARGLDEPAGVRVARSVDNGVKERLTDDPINGAYAGADRYAMIEFWGDARGLAEILEPTAPGVRVLATMETYLEKTYGPCMTAFENALGGRIVVAGYAPWMFLGSAAKRTQLQNAADWLSRGTLPLRIGVHPPRRDVVRLVPFVRLSADRRRGVAVLLNAGFDPVGEATVHFRTAAAPVGLARPGGSAAQAIAADGTPGAWRLTLRDVAPWSTVAILLADLPGGG